MKRFVTICVILLALLWFVVGAAMLFNAPEPASSPSPDHVPIKGPYTTAMAKPVALQSGFVDIGRLKPVTGTFFKILDTNKAGQKRVIPLQRTYEPFGWNGNTWAQPTSASLAYIYIWNSVDGPRIRFMTNTPFVIEGCRLGEDLSFNVDGTLPVTDECYWPKHRVWLSRPAIDLEDLLKDPTLRGVWVKTLEAHGHTPAKQRLGPELEALGFDPVTGLPYDYQSFTLFADLENMGSVSPVVTGDIEMPEQVPADLIWQVNEVPSLPSMPVVALAVAVFALGVIVTVLARVKVGA